MIDMPQMWRKSASRGFIGLASVFIIAFASWLTGIAMFAALGFYGYLRAKKRQL